jgi:deoxyadenosine/deoxycytidine kinase
MVVNYLKMNIALIGLPGVGKSTLVDILDNKYDSVILKEPLDKWIEYGLLENFYNNMERYSYTFQTSAILLKMKEYKQILENNKNKSVYIYDTLPHTDYCFAKMLYDNNKMNEMEWKLYNEWFDFFIEEYFNIPNLKIIYLYSEPEIVLSRIKNRGRKEEESITLEYLNNLEKYFNQIMNKYNIIKFDYSCNIHNPNELNMILSYFDNIIKNN